MVKALAVLSVFYVSQVFAQGKVEDTMRAGSGGSAGTTQQGPVYDGGVLGPNSAIGGPDVTAVDPEGEVRRKTPKKKPVGTIRVDAEAPQAPDRQQQNPSTTK
jgi:hypothetical protein